MERLTSVVPSTAPTSASSAPPSPAPTAGQNWKSSPVADKKRGPKESLATQSRVQFHKPVEKTQDGKQKGVELPVKDETALDYDIALAAFHSGDLDSAGALVEKLKKVGQEKPGVFHLAVVQLSLAVQEGRNGAKRQKALRPPQIFQQRPIPPKSVIDLSV